MNSPTVHRDSKKFEKNASPRVLLFEDDASLRSLLGKLLKDLGFEVFSFSNPSLCPVYNPDIHKCPLDDACADIVISDVNMPKQTGLELMKYLKKEGCKAKYRALMSGDWTDSDLKNAQMLGCQVFHKPFNLKEISQWLEDCSKQIRPERKLSNFPTKKI